MNAILRECEAVVLTNEAIEVHLSYLRPAVEALAEKVDKTYGRLDEKLGKTNERLDQTNDRISKVQGSIEPRPRVLLDDALLSQRRSPSLCVLPHGWPAGKRAY